MRPISMTDADHLEPGARALILDRWVEVDAIGSTSSPAWLRLEGHAVRDGASVAHVTRRDTLLVVEVGA